MCGVGITWNNVVQALESPNVEDKLAKNKLGARLLTATKKTNREAAANGQIWEEQDTLQS